MPQNNEPHEPFDALLESVDAVSFDLFDTLAVRPLAQPNDLLLLLANELQGLWPGSPATFVAARHQAKTLPGVKRNGEEVTLAARYDAIGQAFSIDRNLCEAIMAQELALELALCRPRVLGIELVRRVQAAGKAFHVCSDTYLPPPVIEAILVRVGVSGWASLCLSSEVGLLKSTGHLFDHLQSSIGADRRILHVGDNLHSDIKMAQAAGFKTFELPPQRDLLRRYWPGYSRLAQVTDPVFRSVQIGAVTRSQADKLNAAQRSFSLAEPHSLGVGVLGPVVMGFATWVLHQARERGLTSLWFLARDGDIVLRACECLAKQESAAPQMRYLLVSRRALSLACVQTSAQALALLQIPWRGQGIAELLTQRFGLDSSELTKLPNEAIQLPDDADRVAESISKWMPHILEHATKERRACLEYLRNVGFAEDCSNAAIVDIGHHGSLQRHLIELTGKAGLGGLYFASLEGMRNIPPPAWTQGFVLNLGRGSKVARRYTKFLQLFELLFLNSSPSLRCFELTKEVASPVYEPDSDERQRFAALMHQGALEFVGSVRETLGPRWNDLRIDSKDAISVVLAMAQHPHFQDALLLNGVALESRFNGVNSRHLIDSDASLAAVLASLWPQGAIELWSRNRDVTAGVVGILRLVVNTLSRRQLNGLAKVLKG